MSTRCASWTEIDAWLRLRALTLTTWEIEIVQAIDRAYVKVHADRARAARDKSA